MKRFLLLVPILFLFSCSSPTKLAMDALSESWAALEPYTIAGIEAAEISDDEERALLREVSEFGKTLEVEKNHAE